MDQPRAVTTIKKWLREHRIATLNVAGSRASGEPRIYQAVFDLLTAVQREDEKGQ